MRDLPIASTGETTPWTNIDLAADGRVVAVELANAAIEVVDLAGIPERATVEQLIRDAGVQLPVRVP